MAKESFDAFSHSRRQMKKHPQDPGNYKFPVAKSATPESTGLPAKRPVGRPRKHKVSEVAVFAAEMTPVHPSQRLPRGLLTPRTCYAELILKTLAKASNHAMTTADVIKMIAKKMDRKFTPADLSELDNGQKRWLNNVQWTRKKLVMMKLLQSVPASGRGVWQLTQEGLEAAQSL